MRWIAVLLLVVFVTTALAACKAPQRHTDSTKGTTKQERSDTGMHDGPM